MTDGPLRHKTDPHLRLDPELLRKASESNAPPPELAEAIAEAQLGPRADDETMVPCTACAKCPLCGGLHVVSATAAREHLRAEAK